MKAAFALGLVLGMTLGLARIPLPVIGDRLLFANGAEVGDTPAPEGTATAASTPERTAAPSPLETEAPEPSPETDDGTDAVIAAAPAPRETSVQVLDGAGDGTRMRSAVEVLQGFGYQVVATNRAAVAYDVTTVLYTDGHEAAAEALRARDPRFAEVRRNQNLSQQVNIHVVVGSDWED